jgi:hypothetical protein
VLVLNDAPKMTERSRRRGYSYPPEWHIVNKWHDIELSFEDLDVRNRVYAAIQQLLIELNLPVSPGRRILVYSKWCSNDDDHW